jgi:hypothetical protein
MIGATDREPMFASIIGAKVAGHTGVVVAVKRDAVMHFKHPSPPEHATATFTFSLDRFGGAKAVSVGELFAGKGLHMVVTCEGASGGKSGVFAIEPSSTARPPIDIAGPEGVKYDLVELIDLDGDGDLDVLTCEESDNLGVIWYENPGRQEP